MEGRKKQRNGDGEGKYLQYECRWVNICINKYVESISYFPL